MVQNKLSLIEVTSLIDAVNKSRLDPSRTLDLRAEQQLNEHFQTDNTLAVYGTLAPGRQNYHIVEPLGGEWTEGVIEGDLQETGWGATLGYPAFRPRAGGPSLQIKVLTSEKLPKGWSAVDEFEGPEYQRVLVPVFHLEGQSESSAERSFYTVANLYAAKHR